MKTKLSILGVASLAVMALPMSASAQTSMTMGGAVTPTCTFAFTGGTTGVALDLTSGVPSSTNFDVICNTRSIVSYKSDNGYLKLITTDTANDSYSEGELYSVANPTFDAGLDYVIDLDGVFPISTDILPAGSDTVVSGNAPAINATGRTMNFTPVMGQQLLGGVYADVFTVTVTALGV